MLSVLITTLTIGGAANTLTYEGGTGADTIKIGHSRSSTIGAMFQPVGGDDSSILVQPRFLLLIR